MLRESAGPDGHIRDAVWEIENVEYLMCIDMRLRSRALVAFERFRGV